MHLNPQNIVEIFNTTNFLLEKSIQKAKKYSWSFLPLMEQDTTFNKYTELFTFLVPTQNWAIQVLMQHLHTTILPPKSGEKRISHQKILKIESILITVMTITVQANTYLKLLNEKEVKFTPN